MEGGSTAGTVVLVHGGFVDGSGWQGVYSAWRESGRSTGVGLHLSSINRGKQLSQTELTPAKARQPAICVYAL